MSGPGRPYGSADLLREARHRVPEVADALAHCAAALGDPRFPEPFLAECVCVAMAEWARETEWEPDRGAVLRLFDVWNEAVEHPRVSADLVLVVGAALRLLRVPDQPYGREVTARAGPRMRRLIEGRERAHPRDEHLTFDDEAHAYYVRGRRLRSVTEVVAAAFPTFDAEAAAERVVRSPRNRSDPTYAYYGMTKADVVASWEGKGTGAQALGTALHGEIERALAGAGPGPEASRVGPEFGHFRAYRRDHAGHAVVRTEWRIYDEERGLAGTVDAVFRDPDGRYVLVDWKRSRGVTRENRWEHGYGPVAHLPHTNYWHYALQLNLYASVLERHYGVAVAAMRLVVLHPSKASYEVHEVPRLTAEVEALLRA